MKKINLLIITLTVQGIAGLFAATNRIPVVTALKATNDVTVVAAVKAMEVAETDQASEAVEVAEAVRREESKQKTAPTKDLWEAFMPPSDSNYDWLQLTSGEWLKGDFKVLYDYTLEFDSDELGLLEFDFEDVRQLRTRAMKTVFVEGEESRRDTAVLRGLLTIRENQVILRRSEHEITLPRDRVISIAGGRQQESKYWSGMLSAGLNVREGNTETADSTVQANLKRRTARSRFHLDYLANYSSSRNVETANNQRLSGFHNWFLTGRLYWKTIEVEYYRDPFSNIEGQYSASTGAGYDFIHSLRTEWTVTTGVGHQELRFVSVQPGEDKTSSSPFFTAGTRLDYELTDDIDCLYNYSLRLLNEDNGRYTHHMLASISFDLIGDLDLDVSVIWDRIEKPQPDADGIFPERDDYQTIISLAYEF